MKEILNKLYKNNLYIYCIYFSLYTFIYTKFTFSNFIFMLILDEKTNFIIYKLSNLTTL